MILNHAASVPAEPTDKPGLSSMHTRVVLTADDGCPRYALRLMEFGPGGYTSYHCHKEEHEMFFLEGFGVATGGDRKEVRIAAGDALSILPREYHQIRNTGAGMLKMICTVPIFPGKTGKTTTPCQ